MREIIGKYFCQTPPFLTLFVTNRCNFHCQHCFYWKNLKKPGRKKELSLKEIEKLSQDLGRLKLLSISGGEPFLRSDLADIVRIFTVNNQLRTVSIVTNATLPGKIKKEVKKMLEISNKLLVVICLSVDGTEKMHDSIRGVKGSFKKVVETYKKLRIIKKRYKNLRIRLNATVFNLNYKNLYQLIDQVPQLFPGNYLLSLSLLRGKPRKKSLKLPPPNQLKKLFVYKINRLNGERSWSSKLLERIVFAVQMRILNKRKQIVPCEAGRLMGVVLEDGRVAPCELLSSIGSIREDSFRQIWQSKKAKSLRKKIVKRECFCTHECVLFPSLIAHPLSFLKWKGRNS